MGWSLWHAAVMLQSQDGEFSTLLPLHFVCELLKRGEIHWQSTPYVPCVCLASQATSGGAFSGRYSGGRRDVHHPLCPYSLPPPELPHQPWIPSGGCYILPLLRTIAWSGSLWHGCRRRCQRMCPGAHIAARHQPLLESVARAVKSNLQQGSKCCTDLSSCKHWC
jgi:hypothetical protein